MVVRMSIALAMLIAWAQAAPVEIPRDAGLYYLTPQGLVRIEGRSVTVAHPHKKVPLTGASGAKGEVLGAHSGRSVSATPVFYYRPPAGEESTGAGDLVLVRLKTHGQSRELKLGSEADWKASAGIPLRSQVQFNSRQVESGVFRLEPADDLAAGEYGFYLFRGRDLPGILYDFSVPAE